MQVFDFPFFGWLDAHRPQDLTRQELWYDPLVRERFVYEIKVQTADRAEAGGGSHLSVWVVLYGQYGNSKRQRLTETSSGKTRGLFKRGREECFNIPVSHDLGELKKVHIGIDQKHRTRGSSWLLDTLAVRMSRWIDQQEQRESHTSIFKNSSRVQLGGGAGIPEDMFVFSEPLDVHAIMPFSANAPSTGRPQRPPHIFPSEGYFHTKVDICIAAQVLMLAARAQSLGLASSGLGLGFRAWDWHRAV